MKYDIVGFGACGIDIVTQVAKLPSKNQKVLATSSTVVGGGVTANNLVQCAKLNLKTAWIGVLGNDHWYNYSIKLLQEQRVNVPVKIKASASNGQFFIFNDKQGNNCMVGLPLDQRFVTPRIVTDKFTSIIKNANCLHIEIAVTSIKATYRAAQIAKKYGVKIILDVDVNPLLKKEDATYFYKILKICDVVKTTSSFYKWIKVKNVSDALKVLYSQGPKLVVFTLADKGSIAYDGKKIWRAKGITVKTVDTAGAGDAFMGGLSYGLEQNWSIDKILNFANACGAYKCTKLGTRSSGSLISINKFYKKHYGKL